MRRENCLRRLATALVILSSAADVLADADVFVRSSGFSPASVTIAVGQSVNFWVDDDYGPYCIQSDTGAWTPWYLWDYGDGLKLTINERGDYAYHDAFTWNRGVIHVGGSVTTNVPPSVSITAPRDGELLTEPASFTFTANVSDPDNGIMCVDFYVGADLVDSLFSAPFSTQVSNLAAGTYTLSAVAYDGAWAAQTNSVSITVQTGTPPQVTLSPPVRNGGELQFQAVGLTPGKQAVLQACDGMAVSANWVPLQTNTVSSGPLSFSAAIRPGSQFFRVLQLP